MCSHLYVSSKNNQINGNGNKLETIVAYLGPQHRECVMVIDSGEALSESIAVVVIEE